MYDYQTGYHAHNKYELSVPQAVFQLLVLPSDGGRQQLLDYNLKANVPHEWWTGYNAFGANCILLAPKKAFTEIEIDITTHVQLQSINSFERPFVNSEEQWNRLTDLSFRVEHGTYLAQTSLTIFQNKEISSLPPIDKQQPMIDYIVSLKNTLYDQLQYDGGSTDAHTPAHKAWANRKGVCQDFGHVFIGWCRMLGIPARYVSGYLSQGHQYRGDGQLHAWAECYLPEDGWVGVDASNNLLVDHHYIKIAHGRDYYDCSAMTGVLISGGKQVSLHSVSVDMQSNQ
ncbi:MAG: transglutaminase family protein [Cyclobacteriaceae bacterium]